MTTDAPQRPLWPVDDPVAFRAALRDWVESNWDTDITVREWWSRLAGAGLSAPTWPERFGGLGLSNRDGSVVEEVLAGVGTIAAPMGHVGFKLAGPTIMEHGTAQQCAKLLPALLRGEESWCQLYSEPGAGSDLPGLATKAVDTGDGWLVTGQKVWNSSADVAQRAMLLARTDADVPKTQGITYFLLDMNQPGIEVRPIVQMNGDAKFCEVFLDDAYVSRDDVLGRLNNGWVVNRTTLAYERSSVASRPRRGLVELASGAKSGNLDRVIAEVLQALPKVARHTGNALPWKQVLALAQANGTAADPCVCQELVRYYTMIELQRMTALRSKAALAAGRHPGPEGSITKLVISQICRKSRDLSFAIMGAYATLAGESAPEGGELLRVGLGSPGVSIGGGTDEIQRNTIGERALGLPHEPQTDRNVAFKDLIGTGRQS